MILHVSLFTMFLLLLLRHQKYRVKLWKIVPLTFCIAVMGLIGTRIMFFIENGAWYGKSFFGAVLFFPVLLLPVAFVFRMHILDLLDYATPPGVALLAIFKWNCYLDGCCAGKVLWYSEAGVPAYFPSQLVEMGTAITIAVILLLLEFAKKAKRKLYPICLIVYGLTRYALNHYRWDGREFLFGMPAGNLWSTVSIYIGSLWIVLAYFRNKKGLSDLPDSDTGTK